MLYCGEGTDIAILWILLNWDGLKHIKTYEMPYFSGLRSVTTSFLNVKHRGYTVQTKQRQKQRQYFRHCRWANHAPCMIDY